MHNIHAVGRQKLAGHLAMVLFATLIAVSFSLGAQAAPHIAPAALNAVRFVIGAALMGAVAFALAGRAPAWSVAPWRFIILGGAMGLYFVTMFVALRLTDPVSAGAIFTLVPLMSAGFGYVFLGQIPRRVVVISLVIAAAGALWVIFRGDIGRLLRLEMGPGEAIFFVGCIGHAAYAPLVRKFKRDEPLAAFTFWTLVATLLWIAAYGIGDIAATDWTGLPAIVWIAVAYLAIFTTAGTFFLLQFASIRLPAAKVLAYGYLTPTIIILIEGLIGHGWASSNVLVGALMTVSALIVVGIAPDR